MTANNQDRASSLISTIKFFSLFFLCYCFLISPSIAQSKLKEVKCFVTYHNNGKGFIPNYVIKQRPHFNLSYTNWGDTLLYQEYRNEKPVDVLRKVFNENGKLIEEYRFDKRSKLFIQYHKNGNISRKSLERQSFILSVILTETFYENGKVKEITEERKTKDANQFLFFKKLIFNQLGKLIYKDSLHSFITTLKPNNKYEHIRICDTNTVKYNGKDIRFYRKLYLNNDSVLFKTVEYRNQDSLVCTYSIKGDSLVREYVSDSYYKGTRDFYFVKNYFYGLDIAGEHIAQIFDVKNYFNIGLNYISDGFGRVIDVIFAANSLDFSDIKISFTDRVSTIYPHRKIDYDYYGNIKREVSFFPQHSEDGRPIYTRKGKVARLFEYQYNLKGEIKVEKISGCIIKGVLFDDNYPDFKDAEETIDSNFVLIRQSFYDNNNRSSTVGFYDFKANKLDYKQYKECYFRGTFAKKPVLKNADDSPVHYIHTGKPLLQHVILKSIGFEGWKNFYYDSNDSLIRMTTNHKGALPGPKFNPGLGLYYGIDPIRIQVPNTPCTNGTISNYIEISKIYGPVYDWEFKNGILTCFDNNEPDPMKMFAEWTIKEFDEKTGMVTNQKYSFSKKTLSRGLGKSLYDPLGRSLGILHTTMDGDTTLSTKVEYKNKKISKLTTYSYSYIGKKKEKFQDSRPEVRVYKYDSFGNIVALDEFYHDQLVFEYRWLYQYYDK